MVKEQPKHQEIFDIHYFINLLRRYWFWIGLTCFIAVVAGYIYSKTKPNIYKVQTSVVVYEEQTGLAGASAQMLTDMGFSAPNKKFANEVAVLHSSPLVNQAISTLDLQVSYYKMGRFKNQELYKSTPFIVILNQDHPQPIGCEFRIDVVNDDQFHITAEAEEVPIVNLKSNQTVESVSKFNVDLKKDFREAIVSENMDFKIIFNSNYNIDELKNNSYSFFINTKEGLVKSFLGSMEVEQSSIESTIANISLYTTTPQKGIDFLNSLTSSYIKMQEDRNQYISNRTIEYIDNQLNKIQSSLQVAEQNLQQFRSQNELIDLSMQSGQIFEELQKMENQKVILEVNLKYYEYIDEYFDSNNDIELIAPSAMGIDDPMLNNLIEELIKLDAERSSLVENNQQKSPYLKKINIRIENLKSKVAENISYYKQTNKINLEELNSRIRQLNREIRTLPKTQRELVGYERQFNINDAIYSYLLQKKAEAEITSASYQANVEILEPAEMAGSGPVSPKKKIILMGAFFVGLIAPILVFQTKDSLRNTFHDADEIKNIFSLPFAGEIYANTRKSDAVVMDYPNAQVTESFKRLRMQLNYLLPDKPCKLIAISSTISQEGKSFVSLNLGITLAKTGFKTILLGFDLRKPKLFSGLNLIGKNGISEYLSSQAVMDDITQETPIENLHAIWAGNIPPNPAELIASKNTNELLKHLQKEYDYVIIDTPPIGLLSEGLMLYDMADLKLFVARLNRTPIKEVKKIIGELSEQKIKNVAMVINGIPPKNRRRYGYGYYE